MKERFLGWISGLIRPFPLMIGLIGYGATLSVKELPLLAAYASSWYWLLILSGISHGLLALHESYQDRTEEIEDPSLKELVRLRRKIAFRTEKSSTGTMRTEIPDLLNQLDQEILPRIKALAIKHQQLGKEMASYQNPKRGQIKPSAPVLNELQRLYEKQEDVLKGTLQEVADIDATLSGFIQEGDDSQIVLSMQEWKENLGNRWKILKELLEQ